MTKFLEMKFLGQEVCAFFLLIRLAKLTSIKVVLSYTLRAVCNENAPLPHALASMLVIFHFCQLMGEKV